MTSNLFDRKYTQEEVERILDINRIPNQQLRPEEAFYKKSATEL